MRSATQLAAAEPPTPLFDEDWWLDAAAPGAWDRLCVAWDMITVGTMVVHVRRRWGLTFLEMPPLTRTMSPRIFPQTDKANTRLLNTVAIVGDLMAKAPRHDRFERALAPGCPTAQGFVHAGCAVTHTYTFRSTPQDDASRLLAAAHQKTRNVVLRARRDCAFEASLDLDRFIRLHRNDFGASSTLDYEVLNRIFSAASKRGQAEILFARLNDEFDTAACITVWDRNTAYYWLSARHPTRCSPGATGMLIFEAMNRAHEQGRAFDLDGYVSPQVGLFLAKFGLAPAVRPYVNRSNSLWKGLNALTTLGRSSRHDRNYRV